LSNSSFIIHALCPVERRPGVLGEEDELEQRNKPTININQQCQ
jgi:hypothetical protein